MASSFKSRIAALEATNARAAEVDRIAAELFGPRSVFDQVHEVFGLPFPPIAPPDVLREGKRLFFAALEKAQHDGDLAHLDEFRQWVAEVHSRYGVTK